MKYKATSISVVINDLSHEEERWFAVYTKYKCEKYVVDRLAKKGIAAYVPLTTKVKVYSSRIKKYEVPLINNYIFVKIKKSEYVHVLETEYVFNFIKQRKNIISIPEKEIDMLKMIVGELENVEATTLTLEKGDEVEIVGGSLTGIRGELIENEGNNKFIVKLKTVGLQLMMTIEKSNLRLLKRGNLI